MSDPVEIRTDNRLTGSVANAVGPEVAMELHQWPEELPSADEPVTVAVMDSGIHEGLENHPWFENTTVTKRYDATGDNPGNDEVGHGSGCASIIGTASASIISQLAGDDVPVEFYDVRIFGDSGRTGILTIADAYQWLIDHGDEIDIVNMSWGARKDVPQINQLHDKLLETGVHDVVAAGNTGDEGGSPATAPKAFSAGAVDRDGDLTRFTSRDPNQDNPDVAALGKNVMMARAPGTAMGNPINEQYTMASGTSFSAPYTAAAYVLALYKKRASWDGAFEDAAKDIPGSKADGEGLLRLAPALDGEPPEGDDPGDDDPGEDDPEDPGDDGPKPTANVSVFDLFGMNIIATRAKWLDTGQTTAKRVRETNEAVYVKYKK